MFHDDDNPTHDHDQDRDHHNDDHHDHDHHNDNHHDHDHEHDHSGGHGPGHDHDHDNGGGVIGWVKHLFTPHSHSYQTAALDPALANARGVWALKISLIGLLATAFMQVGVVIITNSVALLADTIHNFSDALTAVPLWIAFALARRIKNRRYTYGYGRAEDLAGVLIVLMIFASAVQVFYESIKKIITPAPVENLGWLAAAAIIGFIGNELVAMFRIRVGREIGSAALVADGLHARTDGLTSLGVLAGAIGVWLGFPLADPIVGILIGVTILVIVREAARDMWYRMMDAVDPELTEIVQNKAASIEGVMEVHDISIRWVGHRLRGELHTIVDCKIPTYESHQIAEEVRHGLFHELPALIDVVVHIDPCECEEREYHPTGHHVAHS